MLNSDEEKFFFEVCKCHLHFATFSSGVKDMHKDLDWVLFTVI